MRLNISYEKRTTPDESYDNLPIASGNLPMPVSQIRAESADNLPIMSRNLPMPVAPDHTSSLDNR